MTNLDLIRFGKHVHYRFVLGVQLDLPNPLCMHCLRGPQRQANGKMNFLIKGVARELMGARARRAAGALLCTRTKSFSFFFSSGQPLSFLLLNKVEEVVEGSRAKLHVHFCRRPFSEVKAISG